MASFRDWDAGALQVKWNRVDENILASSHDRSLHIWDLRKGVSPVKTILAHDRSIRGLDWNRTRRTGIVTCSLDKTVKFWDYSRSDKPERVLLTNTPVWRARHTPFGWGLMTMPKRGDTTIYLWDRRTVEDGPSEPVAAFSGHKELVQEFLWRSKGGEDEHGNDARQFQLVTYSEDHQVKLWPIKDETLVAVGHQKNKPIRFRLTRKGADDKTFRKEPPANLEHERFSALNPPLATFASKPGKHAAAWKRKAMGMGYMTSAANKRDGTKRSVSDWIKGVQIEPENTDLSIASESTIWNVESLGTELAQLSQKFPNVEFEHVNVAERKCTISLSGPWGVDDELAFVRLRLVFPDEYPETKAPKFELEETSGVSAQRRKDMMKFLVRISGLHTRKGRPCMEACFRYLVGEKGENAKWKVRREEDSGVDTDTEETTTSMEDSMIMSSIITGSRLEAK